MLVVHATEGAEIPFPLLRDNGTIQDICTWSENLGPDAWTKRVETEKKCRIRVSPDYTAERVEEQHTYTVFALGTNVCVELWVKDDSVKRLVFRVDYHDE